MDTRYLWLGWALCWIRRRHFGARPPIMKRPNSLLGLCVLATLAPSAQLFRSHHRSYCGHSVGNRMDIGFSETRADRKGRISKLAFAAAIFWVVVLAIAATQTPQNYDAGLYYLQSIAWLTTAPWRRAWETCTAARRSIRPGFRRRRCEPPFLSGNSPCHFTADAVVLGYGHQPINDSFAAGPLHRLPGSAYGAVGGSLFLRAPAPWP